MKSAHGRRRPPARPQSHQIARLPGRQSAHANTEHTGALELILERYPNGPVFATPIAVVPTHAAYAGQNRFPLALEDLVAMRDDSFVVAEGFGFAPDLLVSTLSSVHQAIWFVPTDEFKWASMQRRKKPYFREMVSDPVRGVDSFFQRDMMLAELVKVQAEKHGFQVATVDGSRSIDDMADLAEQHLVPYFQSSNNEKK